MGGTGLFPLQAFPGPDQQQEQMLQFLLDYRRLNAAVEHCVTKPIKTNIDVTSKDLPRELAIKRANDEKYAKMKEMLDAKDEVIWELVKYVKQL